MRIIEGLSSHDNTCNADDIVLVEAALKRLAEPACVDVESLRVECIKEWQSYAGEMRSSPTAAIRATVSFLAAQGHLHPKQEDMVLVPRKSRSTEWYFDFIDRKPYRLQRINDRLWSVISNPDDVEISSTSLPHEHEIFFQKFDNKETAEYCYRVKMAEGLHTAMIEAYEQEKK